MVCAAVEPRRARMEVKAKRLEINILILEECSLVRISLEL